MLSSCNAPFSQLSLRLVPLCPFLSLSARSQLAGSLSAEI